MKDSNPTHPTIVPLTLGPVQTNTYLVGDEATGSAVVIDPAWDAESILATLEQRGWQLQAIWLTHAHFDHLGGVAGISNRLDPPIPIALHPQDMPLWRASGGAKLFGFGGFDAGPEPSLSLTHEQELVLGEHIFQVRHTPGHTPGHVIFVHNQARLAVCGDLIFQSGVGRTDLPGGSWQQLLESIQQEVLVLPDDTKLYPGHGPATTVGEERRSNPFLALHL